MAHSSPGDRVDKQKTEMKDAAVGWAMVGACIFCSGRNRKVGSGGSRGSPMCHVLGSTWEPCGGGAGGCGPANDVQACGGTNACTDVIGMRSCLMDVTGMRLQTSMHAGGLKVAGASGTCFFGKLGNVGSEICWL